ncbi:MAG: diguanylate cyclase, partial [Burkholderiales bacterium]
TEDVAGRVGGDEFVVLVHGLGGVERMAREGALRMAEDLIKTLSQPYEIDGQTLEIGASVGIRMMGFDKPDADMAMVGVSNWRRCSNISVVFMGCDPQLNSVTSDKNTVTGDE